MPVSRKRKTKDKPRRPRTQLAFAMAPWVAVRAVATRAESGPDGIRMLALMPFKVETPDGAAACTNLSDLTQVLGGRDPDRAAAEAEVLQLAVMLCALEQSGGLVWAQGRASFLAPQQWLPTAAGLPPCGLCACHGSSPQGVARDARWMANL